MTDGGAARPPDAVPDDEDGSEPLAGTLVTNPKSSGLEFRMGTGPDPLADLGGAGVFDYAGERYVVEAAGLTLGAVELHLAPPARCDAAADELSAAVRCLDAADRPSGVARVGGDLAVDLLAASAGRSDEGVRIPAGTYTHAALLLQAHGPAPAGLGAWASLIPVVAAPFDGVDVGLPAGETLYAGAAAPVTVEGGGALLVRLDRTRWFPEVDLRRCAYAGAPPLDAGRVHRLGR